MKNVELVKYSEENDFIIIKFSGDFFNAEIQATFFERNLKNLRLYLKEMGVREEDIKVKFSEGSLEWTIYLGLSILGLAVTFLTADYENIPKNFGFLSNYGKRFVTAIIEPIVLNRGASVILLNKKREPLGREIKSEDAKKILPYLSIEKKQEEVTLLGTVETASLSSKFVLIGNNNEETNLILTQKQSLNSVKDLLGKYIKVVGLASINDNGIVTSIEVAYEDIEVLQNPQSKFDFSKE